MPSRSTPATTATPVLNINTNCPRDDVSSLGFFEELAAEHATVFSRRCWILSLKFLYNHCYPYPRLFPLAEACPSETGVYLHVPALKFVFFPQGVQQNVYNLIDIVPAFRKKGFLTNASNFFSRHFPADVEPLQAAIDKHSSIWLLAMVKTKGKWNHEIVGGMLYTSSGAIETSPPAGFIHYIAVSNHANSTAPAISLNDY